MPETTYKGRRLIVRRTRLTDAHQARLWPDWRHFGFLTDLADDVVAVAPGVVGVNWNVTLISGKFLGRSGGTLANAVKAATPSTATTPWSNSTSAT